MAWARKVAAHIQASASDQIAVNHVIVNHERRVHDLQGRADL